MHHTRPTTRSIIATLAWLPACVVATIQSYASLSRPVGDRLPDLAVYVGAVTELRHHHSLYDFITSNSAPFTYPPIAGLLLLPAAWIAERPLEIAWTVVTVAIVFVLAVVAARAAETDLPHARRWLAPGLAVALFASAPVSSNLRYGQVSVGLALIVSIDLLRMSNSRWQGVLTGIAAAIKLTPLVFIPLLFFAGRRRAAIVATSTFLAAAGLAFAIIPSDSRRFWGTEVWQVNRLGHITKGSNQSFNGAMLRLGVADHPRSLLMFAVAAVIGAVALWRGASAGRRGDWLSATIVVGAASTVISPVSWTHHLVWLVLAVLLPVRGPTWARVVWAGIVLIVMILPVTEAGPAFPGFLDPLVGDLRLLLAIAIATMVPLSRRVETGQPATEMPRVESDPVSNVT